MNIVETIHQKVLHLPPQAQEEVLDTVEMIERRYNDEVMPANGNGEKNGVHPLTLLAQLSIDVGVDDLSERHDFYAHGKLED